MATKQIANSLIAPDGSHYVVITDGAGTLQPVQTTSFPPSSTPITASATGTTAATVATLAATAGKTTYIAGFTITSDATAATVGNATVAGVVTGTMTYRQAAGAVASATATLTQYFYPAIPASAANTAIVITSAAAGTAGNTAVTAWGYQL